jgi:hypothetical protein
VVDSINVLAVPSCISAAYESGESTPGCRPAAVAATLNASTLHPRCGIIRGQASRPDKPQTQRISKTIENLSPRPSGRGWLAVAWFAARPDVLACQGGSGSPRPAEVAERFHGVKGMRKAKCATARLGHLYSPLTCRSDSYLTRKRVPHSRT